MTADEKDVYLDWINEVSSTDLNDDQKQFLWRFRGRIENGETPPGDDRRSLYMLWRTKTQRGATLSPSD